MVYTSQSAALAALEMLVHLGRRSTLLTYVLIPCTFDEAVVMRLDRKRLRGVVVLDPVAGQHAAGRDHRVSRDQRKGEPVGRQGDQAALFNRGGRRTWRIS